MPKKYAGYTLIEILVVISLIALISTFVFVNFRGNNKEQLLNKTINQIQSSLKLAQNNASAGVLCGNQIAGSGWSVNFPDNKSLQLICDKDPDVSHIKTIQFDRTIISSLKCSSDISLPPPLTVSYSSLSGLLTFSPQNSCLSQTSEVQITLQNDKDATISKTFKISKGGAVNVQ